jgi:hypothetical protein
MKKLFSLLLASALLVVCSHAYCQQGGQDYLKSSITHVVPDTAANSTPLIQTYTLAGYWDQVIIQSTFTKISGTITGTIGLYGSTDNFGFSQIDSVRNLTNVALKTHTWYMSPSPFKYYKLIITPSGTLAVKVQSPILWRIKPIIR